MSRSAWCLVVVGLGASVASGCGDDVQIIGVGGSGGSSGGAGTAGSGGAGGAAGAGGAPDAESPDAGVDAGGNGGTGGSGGAGGTGGVGGSGGDAGSGGTGGSGGLAVDAGPDEADASTNGNCPALVLVDLVGAGGQQVAISRVLFNLQDASAEVFLTGLDAAFNLADPMHLCSGPDNCIPIEQLGEAPLGSEVSIVIDVTVPEEGELAVLSNEALVAPAFPFAYLAWGEDYVSLPPEGGVAVGDAGPPASLEARVAERQPPFWTVGERIAVDAQTNAFVAVGDVTTAAGYVACTTD